MARAQLEVSFQWIFAIIAGGVLLLFFVFAFRGCVQSGEERVSATSLRTAITTIRIDAWQPVNTTRTMPSVDVMCVPGGALTLTTRGDQPLRDTLDNVPAFLSPTLSGSTRVVVKELFLPVAQQGDPRISLGSVLYAMSPDVQYYIIKPSTDSTLQPALDVLNIKQNTTNIKIVTSPNDLVSATVPSNAKAVIIVGTTVGPSTSPPSNILGDVPVYLVKIESDKVTFFTAGGQQGTPLSTTVPELQAGAIVAGRRATFDCSKTEVDRRTNLLRDIWATRANKIAIALGVSSPCASKLTTAKNLVNTIDDRNPVSGLYTSSIRNNQHDLYVSGCPVIA